MFQRAGNYVLRPLMAIKPAFISKKPHFSFISAHYFWIIGATIVASIAIYASRKDSLAYIDALMFASGANTQAGLNPVDVDTLNTFQQIMIYVFAMLSSPITLHGSVVYLRLYWFEKRFQGWVKDAKQRRMSFSKSRSKARNEASRAEQGVNGRNITVLPRNPENPRVANDGVLLSSQAAGHPKSPLHSDESDITTITDEYARNPPLHDLDRPSGSSRSSNGEGDEAGSEHEADSGEKKDGFVAPPTMPQPTPVATAITFANTVKRSDGVDDDMTKFPQPRSNAEHIAILERQRNQDNEVLRIPGPRDAERGLGPTRLGDNDDRDDDDRTIARAMTRDSHLEQTASRTGASRGRMPTIVIEEPGHPRRREISEDIHAAGGLLDTMRFRKPRLFKPSQNKVTEDDAESGRLRAVRSRTVETLKSAISRDKTDDMPYLSYTPTLGRNSNFVGLTLEQREELGGIEYRSLRTLAFILLAYFWGFQVLAVTFLLPYIQKNQKYGAVVDDINISRTWWAFFTSSSAFMDLGFTLTPDSMISFNTSQYVLMVMWFFILIGNTGFPVMLRFIIWMTSKVIPKHSGLWDELRFLLDHPRRCFTLLFPSGANWWLFFILVVMNGLDLLFFIILDLDARVVEELPVPTRVVNGLFQAASTRTAGFSSLPLSALHPAMLVLYLIMMYISIFPIAMAIRSTNVYEEKSLGVYHRKDDDDDDLVAADASALSYVGSHLRRQLSFDLWYVFLGLFVISISEGSKIQAGEFDLFSVLFEIVSAYGTVGMSIGVPTANASLCSQFSVVGKLVIVAMQIRGRHRGLPYGLDRAVLLPNEYQFQKETEEPQPILARTNTNASATTATASGAQRPGSASGRTRSLSRDHGNRNLLVQLLHPGPAVPPEIVQAHRRSTSNDSQTPQEFQFQHFPRTQTEPVFEMSEEENEDSPQPSPRARTRRVRTFSTPGV